MPPSDVLILVAHTKRVVACWIVHGCTLRISWARLAHGGVDVLVLCARHRHFALRVRARDIIARSSFVSNATRHARVTGHAVVSFALARRSAYARIVTGGVG